MSRKRLEIKQLSKYFEYVSRDLQITGRAEHWTRWEWNDRSPTLGLESILTRFDWIKIEKSRIQKKYIISRDELSEVPIANMNAGFAIEITGLIFDNNLCGALR